MHIQTLPSFPIPSELDLGLGMFVDNPVFSSFPIPDWECFVVNPV